MLIDKSIGAMYQKYSGLVLGFHGCDKKTFDNVFYKHEGLKKSENKYDWLGNGIYFWEDSYERAFDWATEVCKRKNLGDPAVIGAIIDLGNCLNLMDYRSSDILRSGYEILKKNHELLNLDMPQNGKNNKNGDVLLRDLDCAVIQQIHQSNHESGQLEFDSVRGVFIEGKPVYPGTELKTKTHIQLCIVNPNCIKGYFIPLKAESDYIMP